MSTSSYSSTFLRVVRERLKILPKKIDCWKKEEYIPYLEKRLEIFFEIEKEMQNGKIKIQKNDEKVFEWFDRERIELQQEIDRGKRNKDPQFWCPTNPDSLLFF